ncbi:hypothetical protein A2875_02330 [Candidatus Gottesmanbacteria bacterium RIFCSPHIGHO2_01_FULL_46_14]|uniref:Uncharacterized protein n=1 Tax=Candidatus Gottesmanbacteria bacterium RIFCSPHIGHO2_01_FULL_46_14 TaxID=1798380 RepID=A0A1F5ZSS1_9BACT|nr:MAG: hypothetical protein A2875_02330 [Candidatus Gottesmanbacteria bacterium RIFCSPHIGHO2_01_FULL_46_14]
MINSNIIVHTINMNTQRITISLPENVYTLLSQQVSSGGVSQYVSETIHSRLIEETIKKKFKNDAVGDFLALRKETKKLPTKRILAAIHKGRRMGV